MVETSITELGATYEEPSEPTYAIMTSLLAHGGSQ